MKSLFIFLVLFGFYAKSQNQWKIHVVDNSQSGADGVKLGEINSDGRLDIVTGWEEGGFTKLYLHPGNNYVKEKWPAVSIGATPDVEDAVFADINNDGKLDVVSCSEGDTKKIFFHRNLGEDVLNPENWKQEVLPVSNGLMQWMYAEPLQIDKRNGVDLIAAGKNTNAAIGWFESPENSDVLNDWEWHEISPVGWLMSILKRDMDNDGDTDIVITDRRGLMQGCRWLENPGTVETQKQPWENHFIGAENLEVMFMCLADINKDGIEDAIICENKHQTIRIYERQNASGNNWNEQIINIPDITGSAKSIEVGDINNDEVPDFVLSTETLGKVRFGLIWLDGRKIKNAKEIDWQKISGFHNAKYDKIQLMDLDNDGDLDVLTCEENFGENSEGLGVIWYENPFR
jgi:hypothetical protein